MDDEAVLSEALIQAVGELLSEAREKLTGDILLVKAESRATIAELRTEIVELKSTLRSNVEDELRRLADAMRGIKNGDDVDMDVVARRIDEAVERRFALIPVPKDGVSVEPEAVKAMVLEAVSAIPVPKDGVSVEPEAVKAMVQEAVALIPVPKDGVSVEPEAVKAMVQEAVALLPVPKDGVSVEPEAIKAMVSEAVEALPKAKDGISLAEALQDRDGNLVITLTDGSVKNLGRVAGKDVDNEAVFKFLRDEIAKMPVPKDGLGYDDMKREYDGHRTFTHVYTKGDRVVREVFKFPGVIDCGFYDPTKSYEAGDAVTYGGNYMVAKMDTSAKPDDETAWRVAVRRGRDGRDLTPKDENPAPTKQVKLK